LPSAHQFFDRHGIADRFGIAVVVSGSTTGALRTCTVRPSFRVKVAVTRCFSGLLPVGSILIITADTVDFPAGILSSMAVDSLVHSLDTSCRRYDFDKT
jgi:hypothetical protein